MFYLRIFIFAVYANMWVNSICVSIVNVYCVCHYNMYTRNMAVDRRFRPAQRMTNMNVHVHNVRIHASIQYNSTPSVYRSLSLSLLLFRSVRQQSWFVINHPLATHRSTRMRMHVARIDRRPTKARRPQSTMRTAQNLRRKNNTKPLCIWPYDHQHHHHHHRPMRPMRRV